MHRIFLTPYSIRIKKKNTKDYKNFEEIFPNKKMIDIISDFLLSLKSKFTDDSTDQSILRISHVNKNYTYFTVNGIVETGEYGRESKFYDRKSGDHKFDRKKDHAEIMPFYFLIGADDRMNTGLIILQRFGQAGISNVLLRKLKSYIKSLMADVVVEIEPVMSQNVLQKLVKEGDIKRVSFTRYDIPADLASAFNKKGKESSGYLQLNLIAKKNNSLNLNDRLNSLIYGNGSVNKLLTLKDFEYDETKVTIKEGQNVRTITLGSNNFRALYEITTNVEFGDDGHPTFDSLDIEAKSLMTDLFNLLIK